LVSSFWCPGVFLNLNGHNFLKIWEILLLFYWIYYELFLLEPLLLLQCPWFSGLVLWWSWWVLVYSFHRSWVVLLTVLWVFL
jgi:hypothetical protein